MATPEVQVPELIDARLAASGWIAQTYDDMNLAAAPGLAVTESPVPTAPPTTCS